MKPTFVTHQCSTCRRKTGVRDAWAVGERSGVMKRLLNNYKFESCREGAEPLAHLFDATLPRLPVSTVVSWVPTAPSHIRTRGFDHAALLARHLARLRGLQTASLLVRKHTLSQHELSRAARLEAAKDAFMVGNSPLPDSVLLIDDILTTGATLEACVKLLARAGVSDIYVAVAARQPFDDKEK